MATKNDKHQVRALLEALEGRLHGGPPLRDAELQAVQGFLRQHDFAPASEYFSRLRHLEQRLQARPPATVQSQTKRNYGGEAGGYRMQVQSVYDHLILSTCYAGHFNGNRGRVKISHRFNREGRMDFVELKYLRSLHPPLDGAIRKLVLINGYQSMMADWYQARAFVLEVLPRELVFLYADAFRCPRAELLTWLLNIGHGIVQDLLTDLVARPVGCSLPPRASAEPAILAVDPLARTRSGVEEDSPPCLVGEGIPERTGAGSGNGDGEPVFPELSSAHRTIIRGNGDNGAAHPCLFQSTPRDAEQLGLDALLQDKVALPILEKAAALESVVEVVSPTDVLVRYLRKIQPELRS